MKYTFFYKKKWERCRKNVSSAAVVSGALMDNYCVHHEDNSTTKYQEAFDFKIPK